MRRLKLKYDKRITFSKKQLQDITQFVKERIYTEGKNALGQQTPHAVSYDSPRDLYRVLTDELRQSTRVQDDGKGTLTLIFGRKDVILNTLDERYGFTFLWSDADIEFVDDMAKSVAIKMGLPPLEEDPKKLDSLTLQRKEMQEAQREAFIKDMNYWKRKNKNEPLPKTIIDNAKEMDSVQIGRTIEYPFEYNPNDLKIRFDTLDLMNIGRAVKDRIRKNQNVNGSVIEKQILPYLTNSTINSIRIRKKDNKNRELIMQVRYNNNELVEYEKTKSKIFGWGFSDMEFVNNLIRRKLRG